MASLNKSMLDR